MEAFNVPSGRVAQVYILDSAMRLHNMPASLLLSPSMEGLERLPPMASWAFLIESSAGEKALFDLSMPVDAQSGPPIVGKELGATGVRLGGGKSIADILRENEMCPGDIRNIVWSHWHWDHVGDITAFPQATNLVVGPGFLKAYFPGYPSHKDSHIKEAYFQNRKVFEVAFSDPMTTRIGAFHAHDFFGDGSFYLLDTPGHATGHLAGLARTTTNPDTFIFMGGDLGHHGGELRPSQHLCIPDRIPSLPMIAARGATATMLEGAPFRQLNERHGRKENEPFFDPVLADDLGTAAKTIQGAQVADASSDVFLICAHDMAIVDVVDFFPKAANSWKEKGWKSKTVWTFLADLQAAAYTGHS